MSVLAFTDGAKFEFFWFERFYVVSSCHSNIDFAKKNHSKTHNSCKIYIDPIKKKGCLKKWLNKLGQNCIQTPQFHQFVRPWPQNNTVKQSNNNKEIAVVIERVADAWMLQKYWNGMLPSRYSDTTLMCLRGLVHEPEGNSFFRFTGKHWLSSEGPNKKIESNVISCSVLVII